MNKLAIHTHVIFRPRNAMFFLLNNYVFPDWQRWRHCYPLWLPCVCGNLTVVQGEHSLGEWPIPTQLLVWGTLFAVRCNPWSGWWDPGGWVRVNVCNRVHCHWQYTTSARSSCRREVRNGPTWSIGWSRQAQESTTIVLLTIAKNKHCVLPFVLVALGAVARVNQVISIHIAWVYQPCIPGMTVWWLSAAACPLLDSVVGGGMVDELLLNILWVQLVKTILMMGPWKGSTPRFRTLRHLTKSPWVRILKKQRLSLQRPGQGFSSLGHPKNCRHLRYRKDSKA